MNRARLLCLLAGLAVTPARAQTLSDEVVEKLAAHFEAASSRLRAEDAGTIEQFVSRAKSIPGAHLALLVPVTTEPARSRFVAARVSELERHVQSLAETAEYRRISVNSNADVLWLALVLPAGIGEEGARRAPAAIAAKPLDLAPSPPPALTAPAAPVVAPADIRLTDWVVRGVKRPAQGPASAYVARTAPGATPREVFARQTDRELGMIREISSSTEGWVVRTEIGWIGQGAGKE